MLFAKLNAKGTSKNRFGLVNSSYVSNYQYQFDYGVSKLVHIMEIMNVPKAFFCFFEN